MQCLAAIIQGTALESGSFDMRKVLIAGASGLVGYAAACAFIDAGWQVIAVSRRIPPGLETAICLPLNLRDPTQIQSLEPHLDGLSHVVYAALYEKEDLIAGWQDQEQMTINLAMLQHLMDYLFLKANIKHLSLLQGTKAYGSHLGPIPIPARERLPRHPHANFYWLQEDYLKAKRSDLASTKPWYLTILRPQVIFGESTGSAMNSIPAIGVYAAVLKDQGEDLHFPGGPQRVFQAVDADMLGRVCVWAATSQAARDEVFNVNKGEPMAWESVWPAIADALGMDPGRAKPMCLAEAMPKRQAQWAALVDRFSLKSPKDLNQFVGLSFQYTDRNMAYGMENNPPPLSIVSGVKLNQAGFTELVDTEMMFRRFFKRFQDLELIPPKDWT